MQCLPRTSKYAKTGPYMEFAHATSPVVGRPQCSPVHFSLQPLFPVVLWSVVLWSLQSPCARAENPRPLLRDFVGINGHTVQFKPGLYQPVCRLARDYHPVEWDLDGNTAELPPFPLAKNGVDWNQVYGSWRNEGWL